MSAYVPDEFEISHGKKIAYADTMTGSFVDITGTTDIDSPDAGLGTTETTNDSTPGYMKDYMPAMTEPGKVTFTYKYMKSQFAALDTIFQLAQVQTTRNSATKYWKITLADGSVGTVKGFLTKHTLPTSSGDDQLTCECEIQCRSKLVFVPAA